MKQKIFRLAAVLLITTLSIGCGGGSNNGNDVINVIFVDPTGSNTDGTTWKRAYHSVQDAIDAAAAEEGFDVWVAEGTHTNGGGTGPVVTTAAGVNIYGGFEGYKGGSGVMETELSQRNWETNATVLDGENSANHVVYSTNDVIISGFTIRNGQADGGHPHNKGAGVYISAGTIDNCVIENNIAKTTLSADARGGGLFGVYGGTVTIINCTFSNNSTEGDAGGAIYFNTVTAYVIDTDFINNSADSGVGGAIYNRDGDASQLFSECRFIGNSAENGGAIYTASDDCIIDSCLFSKNSASNLGGAISIHGPFINPDTFVSTLTVKNSVFADNTASMGGAVYLNGTSPDDGNPSFLNCTFFGNRADYYGALQSNSDCDIDFHNCIFYGNNSTNNTYNKISGNGGTFTFEYCNIEGSGGSGAGWQNDIFNSATGADGGGNIDENPLFIKVPDRADITFQEGTTSTVDVWDASSHFNVGDIIEIGFDGIERTISGISGSVITFSPELGSASADLTAVTNWGGVSDFSIDLHLAEGSPSIDTGDPATTVTVDIEGTARPQGSGYDMGAYEQ